MSIFEGVDGAFVTVAEATVDSGRSLATRQVRPKRFLRRIGRIECAYP